MTCQYYKRFNFSQLTLKLLYFITCLPGFDTHSDVEEALVRLFAHLDEAFGAFARELKAMEIWNNVTLIQTSDFARTLNPNGGDGTDHAWGKFIGTVTHKHLIIFHLCDYTMY